MFGQPQKFFPVSVSASWTHMPGATDNILELEHGGNCCFRCCSEHSAVEKGFASVPMVILLSKLLREGTPFLLRQNFLSQKKKELHAFSAKVQTDS
jgi:hypothetical protein